ncbi:MAG: DEAD/DEAH box helicase [Candidatus Odinarchaeum yellowstonii]|uniref:DEAD/DEAH box helicase n=1 Tax=Odinarchaeota yellowstonii (strain LCB_4) TaxID=1841599 RepID=A0AAF0IBR9_ODILC|nr:MAG: DEAD/DEAH box helicase [Candidatus Odinarchaeum yellowstonii]
MNVFNELDSSLREKLQAFGFKTPTATQEKAIPKILKGYHTLIIAPTGSGKTEAAVFPVLNRILQDRESGEEQPGIKALYITPLKALNRDILKRLIKLGETLNIKIEVRHGDTSQPARRKQALKPPDILILTPETLQAILPGKKMREHLRTVKWVIVDEIHELANDERGAQLSIGLERLEYLTGREFQRIGLSATVGGASKIAKFLTGSHGKTKIIYLGGGKKFIIHLDYAEVTEEDYKLAVEIKSTPRIAHVIRLIDKLIRDHKSVLLFTNTREAAEIIASKLTQYNPSFNFAVHHSSLSKEVRLEAESKFKDEVIKCIICTSSLELGIDIGSIDLVIQFMSPRQISKLIQRVGRAGHRLETPSEGYIIAMNVDDILESIAICKGVLKHKIEDVTLHENSLDVLCHQIAGIILDNSKIELEKLYDIIRNSYLYHQIQFEKIKEVVEYMHTHKLVYLAGGVVKRSRKTLEYYYSNLSMIPDVKQYDVVDIASNMKIGRLDEEFVVNNQAGEVFIAKGQAWRIISIEEDVIRVEPAPTPIAAVPSWEGELLPVPYNIARMVAHLRDRLYDNLSNQHTVDYIEIIRSSLLNSREELQNIIIKESVLKKLYESIHFYIENKEPYNGERNILIESAENMIIVHLCYGSKVNQTIAQLIASTLLSKLGESVIIKSDPYRIVIQNASGLNCNTVKEVFYEIKTEYLKPLLETSLKQTALFNWKYAYVAKRFGLIEKDASYSSVDIKRLIKYYDPVIIEETIREILLEKMDLKKTSELLKKISLEEIEVKVKEYKRSLSYGEFTNIVLESLGVRDLISPEKPVAEILSIFKKRLESANKKLICLYCGKYESTRTVGALEDYPKCPICGSRYLAAVYPNDDESYQLVKKWKTGRKLDNAEIRKIKKLQEIGSLVLTMGKKAIIALAARGVGPQNVKRIFSKTSLTEKDILLEILRTEKKYLETRGFWD